MDPHSVAEELRVEARKCHLHRRPARRRPVAPRGVLPGLSKRVDPAGVECSGKDRELLCLSVVQWPGLLHRRRIEPDCTLASNLSEMSLEPERCGGDCVCALTAVPADQQHVPVPRSISTSHHHTIFLSHSCWTEQAL